MNFHILSLVIEELSALLTGARVERVIQGKEGGVYLLLRRNRKNYALLFSPDRVLPRMHLVSLKPQSVATPNSFVLALRSRLTGSRVKTISQLNEDRIARICFATPAMEQCLVYELTGMSANLFLIGADWRIIAVYYPVRAYSACSANIVARGLIRPASQKSHVPLGQGQTGNSRCRFAEQSNRGFLCPFGTGAISCCTRVGGPLLYPKGPCKGRA